MGMRAVIVEKPGGVDALRIAEILYLTELFRRTGGNVSLAARIAGISRPSMHRKIHDLGIDVDSFRG